MIDRTLSQVTHTAIKIYRKWQGRNYHLCGTGPQPNIVILSYLTNQAQSQLFGLLHSITLKEPGSISVKLSSARLHP